MAKFRVHIFEEVRSAYEIEAENPVEAMLKVYKNLEDLDALESECTGDIGDSFCVDTLPEEGPVTYEWLSLEEHLKEKL